MDTSASQSTATEVKVSVILPVYNAEKYVAQAIESILQQTFTDFELLLMNDASTDGSRDILARYAAQDSRIRLVDNPQNLGLTVTLNKAIDLCKGSYIARMDADDISLPTRLETQVKFLDTYPDIGFCGTWAEIIDENDQKTGDQWVMNLTPEALYARMYFHNCFVHTSTMLRYSCLQEKYDPSFNLIEDFELWFRLIKKYRAAIIPKILVYYRRHTTNVTVVHQDKARLLPQTIIRRELMWIGLSPTDEELALHLAIGHQQLIPSDEFITASHDWLLQLWQAFEQHHKAKPELNRAMRDLLAKFWTAILTQPDANRSTVRQYAKAPLSRQLLPAVQVAKFWLSRL